MANPAPVAELHPQFSSPGAAASAWSDAARRLADAKIYWLSTVRPDGRPHVTSLFGVWLDDAFYITTGETERKFKNLAQNKQCVVTTGTNEIEGVDIVLEGEAEQVTDAAHLRRLADAYAAKYDWHYDVQDHAFVHQDGGRAQVYKIAPRTAFGFAKGETFSQTRWRF